MGFRQKLAHIIKHLFTILCDHALMEIEKRTTIALMEMILTQFHENIAKPTTDDLCYRRMPESKKSLQGTYNGFTAYYRRDDLDDPQKLGGGITITTTLRSGTAPDDLILSIPSITSNGSTRGTYEVYAERRTSFMLAEQRNDSGVRELSEAEMEHLDTFLLDVANEMELAIYTSYNQFANNQRETHNQKR